MFFILNSSALCSDCMIISTSGSLDIGHKDSLVTPFHTLLQIKLFCITIDGSLKNILSIVHKVLYRGKGSAVYHFSNQENIGERFYFDSPLYTSY